MKRILYILLFAFAVSLASISGAFAALTVSASFCDENLNAVLGEKMAL
jgi:hypothetical protein